MHAFFEQYVVVFVGGFGAVHGDVGVVDGCFGVVVGIVG